MLSIFFGTDTVKVRQKAHDATVSYRERGAEASEITAATFTEDTLIDAIGGVSLFGTGRVVVLDSLKENTEAFSVVLGSATALATSSTVFVMIEDELSSAERKIFKECGVEITECAKDAAARFNTFALADALARRDKKSLWILYLRALHAGISVEEIIGVLFWQIKSIRLAERTRSAAEAGMKEFPYKKAKAAISVFKGGEADRLSRVLVGIYHNGHRGNEEGDLALEKLILTL
jgi:DNA polymerase III delta subunit